MSEVNGNKPQVTIMLRGENSGRNLIYEGDLELSEQQADQLKQIVGDGQARVTVSKELSHKDYGNGGTVFVSVTLTCDQSDQGIDTAAKWASYYAEKNAVEQHGQLQQTLTQLGIVQ